MSNYKIGRDIGIAPFKYTSKWSTSAVEKIISRVNEMLYFFSFLPIKGSVKTFIDGRLVKAYNEVEKIYISPGDQKIKKKNEFLARLIELQRSLSSYQPGDDPQIDQKASKYQVSAYLRQKDGMSVEDRMNLIRKLKVFARFYAPTESLKSVQRELLDTFVI